MKTVIVLLIALACVSCSMNLLERYPVNFSEKRSIMTLLTQVEAQLQSGGPLDAITNMLNEFVTTVNEEQASHDQLWAEQQVDCDDEISFRQEEVSNADAALKEGQETLDGCEQQKKRAVDDLKNANQQLITNRSYFAQNEDTRRREAYAYETFTTQYQMQTRAIEGALDILDEIFAGEATFLQLSRHCNGILKEAVKTRKAHLMTGVLSALAQLANKEVYSDEQLLQKVKSLFTNLLEKLQVEFQEKAAAEAQAIEEYEVEKARLEEMIANLEAQISGLEAELAELDKCIVTQRGIVNAASTKKDRNARLLADAESLCQAVEEEYFTAKAARAEELELLAAIQERVQHRFAELSDGVTERGMQDEFTYTNESEYVAEEFVASEAF